MKSLRISCQLFLYHIKTQMKNENAQPKEAFKVNANPEYIKLQHSMMILDPEVAIQIAEILIDHVWVMCVSKTNNV